MMNELSTREISILRVVSNQKDGIPPNDLESIVGKQNITAFHKLVENGYIEAEVLENRGFTRSFVPGVIPSPFMADIDYGNYILTEKGIDALAEDDFNREHNATDKPAAANYYEMHGNNFVANGNIHIVDSTIIETVNNTHEIPEELKAELTEILTYLKDKSISAEDKNTRASKFLAFVSKSFGEAAVSSAFGLIFAAMTGQLG